MICVDDEVICVDDDVTCEDTPSTVTTTNSSDSTKLPLPPCMVCGSVSSGFLYGAYTCEACKEDYNIKLEIFGSMPLVPDEQYEEIYQKTGIDVDGREERMKQFACTMNEYTKIFIRIVKTIPGFSDLPVEDQANLVKHTRFEFWFLNVFHGFNNTLKVGVFPCGLCFHINVVSKYCGQPLAERMFDFAEKMNQLNLLPDELVILKTVCLLFTDRCELQDPDKVAKLQWKMVQCLTYLLDQNHKDETGLFARIMDRLTEMRELSEMNCKLSRDLQLVPAFQEKPLLVEMLAI